MDCVHKWKSVILHADKRSEKQNYSETQSLAIIICKGIMLPYPNGKGIMLP